MKKFNKYQPARLGVYTQKIVKPVFEARGFVEGKIITHWPQIVGDRFAGLALPEKIIFPKGSREGGTLYLTVTSSSSLLLHYAQGLILEHINTFFGYKAVSKIKMSHGLATLKGEEKKSPIQPLAQEETEWIEEQVRDIVDTDLKTHLEKLGSGILSKTKSRN